VFSITVYLRIRPLIVENDTMNRVSGPAVLSVSSANSVVIAHGNKPETFTYDFVGDAESTTQEHVFFSVGKPITDNCLQGYNGTIFAYGQTASGKTHTMQGPLDTASQTLDFENRGVIPRCFEYLFNQIARESKKVSSNHSLASYKLVES
jgi:hypothetical protein